MALDKMPAIIGGSAGKVWMNDKLIYTWSCTRITNAPSMLDVYIS